MANKTLNTRQKMTYRAPSSPVAARAQTPMQERKRGTPCPKPVTPYPQR